MPVDDTAGRRDDAKDDHGLLGAPTGTLADGLTFVAPMLLDVAIYGEKSLVSLDELIALAHQVSDTILKGSNGLLLLLVAG